jgi:hypothetical protein
MGRSESYAEILLLTDENGRDEKSYGKRTGRSESYAEILLLTDSTVEVREINR